MSINTKIDRIRYIDCIRNSRMLLITKLTGLMRYFKNMWNRLRRSLSKILNYKERSILILDFYCNSHIKVCYNRSISKKSKKDLKVSMRKKTLRRESKNSTKPTRKRNKITDDILRSSIFSTVSKCN